jgi:hypothetical protein
MVTGGGTRAQTKLESRRFRVSELYVAGRSMRDIREMMVAEGYARLSLVMLYKDIKWMRVHWRTGALRNFDEAKSQELARIDQIETEAWRNFEQSRGWHTVTTDRTGGDNPETTTRREKLCGDPRYLQVALNCVAKRCEIMGLNAPTKIDQGLDSVVAILTSRITKFEQGQITDGNTASQPA